MKLHITRPCLRAIGSSIFFAAVTAYATAENTAALNAFSRSTQQITEEMQSFWDSTFCDLGIDDSPFAQIIFLIRYFTQLIPAAPTDKFYTLEQIMDDRQCNRASGCIALTALMQARGWDVVSFFNDREWYLGLGLGEEWNIRKASWIPLNDRRYYLKEFDDTTAIGITQIDDPASRYNALSVTRPGLQSIPVVRYLPALDPEPVYSRRLRWQYDTCGYEAVLSIPREQLAWTGNLPASISGMLYCAFDELRRLKLDQVLVRFTSGCGEYEQVDRLLKFCQAESVFRYNPKVPIRSISRQLYDGENDCDGRSVLLGALLHTVLEYPIDHLLFIGWENHLALAVQPQTEECRRRLQDREAFAPVEGFYLLDPAYMGATHWGSKMKKLDGKFTVIVP